MAWIDFWKELDEIVVRRYMLGRDMGTQIRKSELLDVEEI
jgi:hypothetical protein